MAQLDAADSMPGKTRCRKFVTDTTSTPLVNNNLKVKLYILASSWAGIESAASSGHRSTPDPIIIINCFLH